MWQILPKSPRRRSIPVALLALATTLPMSADAGEDSARVERRVQAMGTTLTLAVDAPSRAEALAASDLAVGAIAAAERRLSTWSPDSELSRFNNLPAGTSIDLSPELARDLAGAAVCSAATSGAFNPGVGRLVEAWGLRSGGRRPAAEEIEPLLPALRARKLRIDGRRATRGDEAFVIEEGGFGKGVGLDDAAAQLGQSSATGAVLDLGGQIAIWGAATATIDIADPRDRERVVLRLEASHGSVATSGNSERGMRVEGERLGHVLDPRTGRPAPDFGSLTVWAADGATADCLSTGLYAMGPREAARWAAAREDVAVVVLEVSGESLVAHASPGLEGRLHPSVADVELRWIGREP